MTRTRTLLLTLVLALLAAPAARAQNIDGATTALKATRLYVDPSLGGGITADERGELRRKLRGRTPPVYMAVLPLIDGDRVDGKPRQLLSLLARRVGRPGIYVTTADGLLTADADTLDPDAYERIAAAASATNVEGNYREAPGQQLLRFLGAVDDPNIVARAKKAEEAFDARTKNAPGATTPTAPGGRDDGGDAAGTIGAILILLALLSIVVAVVVVLSRRRGGAGATPAPAGQPVLPTHVFLAARNAERARLRQLVDRELASFVERLEQVPTPQREDAGARWSTAMEHYDTARAIVDDEDALDVDLVGALVLEDLARIHLDAAAALEAGRTPGPIVDPCALNPTHGQSRSTARWGDAPKLPVCGDCAQAIKRRRRPDVLEDRGKAYLEQDTPWAATAFGALTDDLPAVVRRARERNR